MDFTAAFGHDFDFGTPFLRNLVQDELPSGLSS